MTNPLIRLAFITLAVLGLLMTTARTKPEPNYFPLQEGYRWKYRTASDKIFTEEILATTSKNAQGTTLYHLQVRLPSGNYFTEDLYSIPHGWIYVGGFSKQGRDVGYSKYLPPYKLLQHSLRVGDSWEWKGIRQDAGPLDVKCVVKGSETISVPAGRFTTIRVDRTTQNETLKAINSKAVITETEWYADGVGLIKSTGPSGKVNELIDYSFK